MARRTAETGLETETLAKQISKDEKLWRISSLTASVDDETTILILPLPESKRLVKVADTKYEAKSYADLVHKVDNLNKSLESSDSEDTGPKRYDDKTEDEMIDEMNRKRKQQFGKLVKFRYYQAGAMVGALFFYIFVYRKWLVSTPVMHSLTYKMSVDFIKENRQVRKKIGQDFQIMNCNGKMYPYRRDVKFDIVLFGTN